MVAPAWTPLGTLWASAAGGKLRNENEVSAAVIEIAPKRRAHRHPFIQHLRMVLQVCIMGVSNLQMATYYAPLGKVIGKLLGCSPRRHPLIGTSWQIVSYLRSQGGRCI